MVKLVGQPDVSLGLWLLGFGAALGLRLWLGLQMPGLAVLG